MCFDPSSDDASYVTNNLDCDDGDSDIGTTTGELTEDKDCDGVEDAGDVDKCDQSPSSIVDVDGSGDGLTDGDGDGCWGTLAD